jgi:hypothetical protein
MAVIEEARAQLTPAEKVARARRARLLLKRVVRIPLACGTCFGTNLNEEEGQIDCLSCGRKASATTLHTIRRQRIDRYIRTGEL